jgi:hypothetical protein
MIHIIKQNWLPKKKKDKDLVATSKNHAYPKICGIWKLWKFKELSKIDLEFLNFKSPLGMGYMYMTCLRKK